MHCSFMPQETAHSQQQTWAVESGLVTQTKVACTRTAWMHVKSKECTVT